MVDSLLENVARQFGTMPTLRETSLSARPFIETEKTLLKEYGYKAAAHARTTTAYQRQFRIVENLVVQLQPLGYEAHVFKSYADAEYQSEPVELVGIIPVLDAKHKSKVFGVQGKDFEGSFIGVFPQGLVTSYSQRNNRGSVLLWELAPGLYVSQSEIDEIKMALKSCLRKSSLTEPMLQPTLDAIVHAMNGYHFWYTDKLRQQ